MLRRSERKRTPALLPSEVAPSLAHKAKLVTRCEEVWERGVGARPIYEFPVWMKPSKNCAIPVDGKYAFIAPPSQMLALLEFINTMPRIVDPEEFRGKTGVYTWILYRKDPGTEIKFAAAFVRSVVELGTLHHALAYATGARTIHGAGELKKRDAAKHEVLVNFQSGSFMEKWILPEDLCTLPEMERFVLGKLRGMLKGLRVDTPRKSSFITDELAPPTMDELKSYAARGFKVCLYDTADECKTKKGTCSTALVGGKKEETYTNMPAIGGTMPWSPRKGRIENIPAPEMTQAAKARLVFASQGLLQDPRTSKEKALAELKQPIRPQSVGLGRKTRRARKIRRVTRKSKSLRAASRDTGRY